jgi:hypothetical protein
MIHKRGRSFPISLRIGECRAVRPEKLADDQSKSPFFKPQRSFSSKKCCSENRQLLTIPSVRHFNDILPLKCGRNGFDRTARHPYITVYDSKAVLKNVNRLPHSKPVRPQSAFARVLSVLLLSFIVYGTTVEAAHKHGNPVRGRDVAASAAVSDFGSGTLRSTNFSGCGDCLICQLQLQFSTTLIANPPTVVPASLRSHFFNLIAVSVISRTDAPRRGRAPPFSL